MAPRTATISIWLSIVALCVSAFRLSRRAEPETREYYDDNVLHSMLGAPAEDSVGPFSEATPALLPPR
jgi:hypothetical protein